MGLRPVFPLALTTTENGELGTGQPACSGARCRSVRTSVRGDRRRRARDERATLGSERIGWGGCGDPRCHDSRSLRFDRSSSRIHRSGNYSLVCSRGIVAGRSVLLAWHQGFPRPLQPISARGLPARLLTAATPPFARYARPSVSHYSRGSRNRRFRANAPSEAHGSRRSLHRGASRRAPVAHPSRSSVGAPRSRSTTRQRAPPQAKSGIGTVPATVRMYSRLERVRGPQRDAARHHRSAYQCHEAVDSSRGALERSRSSGSRSSPRRSR